MLFIGKTYIQCFHGAIMVLLSHLSTLKQRYRYDFIQRLTQANRLAQIVWL